MISDIIKMRYKQRLAWEGKVWQGVTEERRICSYKVLETFAIGERRFLVDPRTCIDWNTSRGRTVLRLLWPIIPTLAKSLKL